MDEAKTFEEAARIERIEHLHGSLFLTELESPRIAGTLEPGQFVHMQIPNMPDRILRRPFSVYRTDPARGLLSIVFQVVGEGTQVLSQAVPGASASLIGPVGNTWQPPVAGTCLLVGGGVGSAPLYMLAQRIAQSPASLRVVLGAQTKDALVTYEEFCGLPEAEVAAATDDGSFGFDGFCTVPASEAIAAGDIDYVACCGPEPVMRIVAQAAADAGVRCEVSLERRMACGVGACLSCVVDTVDGKQRCCVDGPIFDAQKVVW